MADRRIISLEAELQRITRELNRTKWQPPEEPVKLKPRVAQPPRWTPPLIIIAEDDE